MPRCYRRHAPSACCPVQPGPVRNSVDVNSLPCSYRHSSICSHFFPHLISYVMCSASRERVPSRPQPERPAQEILLHPSALSHSHSDHYILALLALLLEAPALLMAWACFSSRSVTQIQNQLTTSTKAKAKKTLFLSPSPPQVLAT